MAPRAARTAAIARRMFAVSAAAIVLSVIGFPTAASATWSVVAVDPETGRVGAVMASCVDPGILGESDQALIPIVLAPGAGVGVVQGTVNRNAPETIRQRLQDGVSAAATLEFLASNAFETDPDQNNSIRQYGIVALGQDGLNSPDLSAVFTGDDVETQRQAIAGRNVAAQGLLLADEAVIDDALAAYQGAISENQTMDQALVDALVAGAEAGGDRRCGDQTALFAQLVVAEPGDDDPLQPSTLLTVTVDEGDGQNPVFAMADAFDQGQRGWIDAGQRSSIGVSKLWAAVVAGLIGAAGIFLLRKGMGNTTARR